MRVLVCGSREWADTRAVEGVMGWVEAERAAAAVDDGDVVVVTMAADGEPGARDVAAAAEARGWRTETFTADPQYGRSAEMIRNQAALDAGRPDLVFCLADDLRRARSVYDMVARARAHRLVTYVVGAAA